MVRQRKFRVMEAGDERQFMLSENYEILEKFGVPVGANQMHSHDFYELLYIEEGEFACHVDNHLYLLQEGDFMLIDRNSLHHYQYVENRHEKTRRILLWVTREYLLTLSEADVDLTVCFDRGKSPVWHFPQNQTRQLMDFLEKLSELYGNREKKDAVYLAENALIERAYMTLFFSGLNRLCREPAFQSMEGEIVYDPMAKQVLEYMDAHIDSALTVEELAAQAALSKYYFLRRFSMATGMTVHEVVIKKRLMYACRMMADGMPVSEAWSRCGYTDYSSFFRKFKSVYGISPREFQKRCEVNHSV